MTKRCLAVLFVDLVTETSIDWTLLASKSQPCSLDDFYGKLKPDQGMFSAALMFSAGHLERTS